MIQELMETFCTVAEANCKLDYNISLKELKAEGGIYAEAGKGFTETKTYGKNVTVKIPILILMRESNQTKCISNLEAICSYFERLKKYPTANSFKLLDAEVTESVNKIARDADGTYHYSCIITCLLYIY